MKLSPNLGFYLAWMMAVENFGIAIAYACAHDWKHAAYWFFAACITISVTI